jgi:biofilm PGA synthesis N-glycosyltransferase PgaC
MSQETRALRKVPENRPDDWSKTEPINRMTKQQPQFVLVTAAYNEEDYIGKTLESVIRQTTLPAKWVIVSDQSTDKTDEIVRAYEQSHKFIKYVRKRKDEDRSTASKVNAIKTGLPYLKDVDYDYIGNLDADISFEPNYFAGLLGECESDKSLGLVGGRIFQVEKKGNVEHKCSLESVPGAVQFFRRGCFEKIGGYIPLKGGLEDGVAEIMARSYGWKTRSIQDLVVLHYRPIGSVGRSVWKARFNSGINEFTLGFGSVYFTIRAFSRVMESPYVLGSLLVCAGYLWAFVSRKDKVVSGDFIRYLRTEHRTRLWLRVTRQSIDSSRSQSRSLQSLCP